MLPGPKLIYRCPVCQGLFARRTLASGNTLGAEWRSDGWMHARMLPRTPPLVACPHCQHTLCMIGAKHEVVYRDYFPGWGFFGELAPEQIAERQAHEALQARYGQVPDYEAPSLAQCLHYLQTQDLKGHEWPLRMHVWHLVNDERLQTGRTALTAHEVANLQALLQSIRMGEEHSLLLRVEILRELGHFDEAAQALDCEVDEQDTARAEQIMQAIERGNEQPFIFESSRDDDDIHFSWAWQARRYSTEVPAEPQNEPMDPPLFRIGNRDWWVKVLGMCSHNWALIESDPSGRATVYFFHDMGTTLSRSNYKPRQLKGRSAVVDSLVFDSLSEAKWALERNGFNRLLDNPGPWMGSEPTGHFYDARETEEGIYSRKGYWQD